MVGDIDEDVPIILFLCSEFSYALKSTELWYEKMRPSVAKITSTETICV